MIQAIGDYGMKDAGRNKRSMKTMKNLIIIVLLHHYPFINHAMEVAPLLYNSSYQLPKDPRGLIFNTLNLLEIEQLMLGSVPSKDLIKAKMYIGLKKENKDRFDKKYKLWAPEFNFSKHIKNATIKKTFKIIQNDFLLWTQNKRLQVESMMNMPQAGSPQEEPYLFKKGWFDSSSDPNNPRAHYIDHDFYLSDFITQEVWLDVMGENPSYFPNREHCPGDERTFKKIVPGKRKIKEIKYCQGWAVTDINLYDARKFIHILNMGSPAHVKYDIPSEWQFDFAARGGLSTEKIEDIINTGKFGSLDLSDNDLDEFIKRIPWKGRISINGPGRTKSLKPFPREFGPHDLIGHLYTWTKSKLRLRRFNLFLTKTTPKKNFGLDWDLEGKKSLAGDSLRVALGANWCSSESNLPDGDQRHRVPFGRFPWLGLRLLRTIHEPL